MRRKLGILCMTVGILLMATVATAILREQWQEMQTEQASARALEQVQAEILDDSSEANAAAEKKTPYMGYVSIPALDLYLPVMADWSEANLNTAPSRYAGSIAENNLVIAGHNYRRQFRKLLWIEEGTDVLFTDMNGTTYAYTVAYTESLGPRQIDMMTESSDSWELTMFTCTVGGSRRWAVRCVYADK